MKPSDLLLRIYGEQHKGQWTLICLEFSLAVQADSLEQAQEKLHQQINLYVREATTGLDRAHAPMLLSRSAPARYWVKYYWQALLGALALRNNSRLATNQALPLVVAAAA